VDRFRRDLVPLAGEEPGRIGVALSGGPDSLALLLLASAAFPGAVSAATVDHGLRPGSASEAALAGEACAGLNVPHRILEVSVPRRASVQAAAREARYGALKSWAREEGVAVLVTAHHLDDQAETLLMRLQRGSGVAGLAGVRARTTLEEGLLLCRPLLSWRRSELADIVQASGLTAVEDPSNSDEAFDRVRVRRALSQASWLDPLTLARSAAALADANEALEFVARELAASHIQRIGDAATLRPENLPDELVRRLLLHALRAVAGDAAPRGDQVGDLMLRLLAGGTATLAGVKCTGGDHWRFEPAPPRRSG
jgi:tRNA(Ile)-lysidine synthase